MNPKELMAHYTPGQGIVVYGKNRLIYLHEEGHSKQPPWIIFLMSNWIYAVMTSIALLAIDKGDLLLIAIFAPPVLLLGYLEADAWIYALKKQKEDKQK